MLKAYGFNPDDDFLEKLLTLNLELAAKEKSGERRSWVAGHRSREGRSLMATGLTEEEAIAERKNAKDADARNQL
ncbi:MAG: hypothetical protein KME15_05940 [Drouetiella hepatica Uher 2000/2452]|uniref:Uncharacterized protein n=1 Tax=Drouetiella hepatica Uher 2000/2452 TaxID=904376 RepID=A0A951QAE0_9CYAN|nr:hypothetical protein [Drouetiella hepatica Uher 2000/2452]